jgi:hypothetical protein
MMRTREVPPRLAQLADCEVSHDDTAAGMELRQHRLDYVAPASHQHGEAEYGHRGPDEHSNHEADHRRLLSAPLMASASSRSPLASHRTQETRKTAAPTRADAKRVDRPII